MSKKCLWFLILASMAILLVPAVALAVSYTISSKNDMIILESDVSSGYKHPVDTMI